MSKVYFLTGGNRGIGFEYVKLLSERANTTVITTTRNPDKSEALNKLASSRSNVHVIKLDISDESNIINAVEETNKLVDHIDVLILNSAHAEALSIRVLDLPNKSWETHWRTNVIGPILAFKNLYPLLKKSETKQVIFISSKGGSIGDFAPFPNSAYGQSKAAINYTMKELSYELDSEGFTVISLHPGVVLTGTVTNLKDELVKKDPEISALFASALVPADSATQQLQLIDGLSKEQNGKFLSYDGSELVF